MCEAEEEAEEEEVLEIDKVLTTFEAEHEEDVFNNEKRRGDSVEGLMDCGGGGRSPISINSSSS